MSDKGILVLTWHTYSFGLLDCKSNVGSTMYQNQIIASCLPPFGKNLPGQIIIPMFINALNMVRRENPSGIFEYESKIMETTSAFVLPPLADICLAYLVQWPSIMILTPRF